MKTFKEFCDENQHSVYCSRAEAFTLGQKSRQAEIDELQKRVDELIPLLEMYGYSGWVNILKGAKK